jgi:hypothetical protein
MFHDLFHPTESGSVSDAVAAGTFKLCRSRPTILPVAGPLALVIVLFSWAMMLALGFALIYWSVFPFEFQLKNSPNTQAPFLTSLYFSLEVMTTLGIGDILPNPTWLRLVVVFHTLVGFSMVTASITWIVLLFPALTRLRTTARKASLLAKACDASGIPVVGEDRASTLSELANDLIRSREDLLHFPIIFHFYPEDAASSLPRALKLIQRFADDALTAQHETERLMGALLRATLDDFARLLATRFVEADENDTTAVIQALWDYNVEDRRKRA